MSATLSPKSTKQVDVRVSAFDQVNAALIAMILLIGFLVTVLFLIWLTTAFDFSRKKPVQLLTYEEPFGDEKPEGYEDDVLEPGVEEFPEVETPQLKDALEAVTDAVSSVKASLEKRDGDAAEMGRGRGVGSRDGGPGTGKGDVIPEHKRWKIEYESESIELYAKQLDHFNIILGAFSLNSNDIALVRNMSKGSQVEMSDRKKESKTLRFEHEKPRMRRWDQNLISAAGVDLSGRRTVQFYPMSTRMILREVEGRHLQSIGRTLNEVRRTFFKVEPVGGGFEYKVREMLFRN